MSAKYIFTIHLHPGQTVEEYLEAWRAGSNIIVNESGCLGTRIYRNLSNPNSLIAMPKWETVTQRNEAMTRINDPSNPYFELTHKHESLATFHPIGYFEKLATVLPSRQGRMRP